VYRLSRSGAFCEFANSQMYCCLDRVSRSNSGKYLGNDGTGAEEQLELGSSVAERRGAYRSSAKSPPKQPINDKHCHCDRYPK